MPKQVLEAVKIQAKTLISKDKKLVAIASTENEDRVGDGLKMSDWDLTDFKRNPVLQAGHDHNPQFTIGIAENIKIEETEFGTSLTFEPKFHEFTQLARDIKAMYEGGILTAWSVGFIPKALMKDEYGNKLGKNELLEVSAVAVPANAECITAAKSYGANEIKTIQEWLNTQTKSLETIEAKVDEIVEAPVEEIKSEEVATEEKGLLADKVDENIQAEIDREIKYQNSEILRQIYWSFYEVYMDDNIGVNMFNTLLLEMSSMLISVASGEGLKSTENIQIKEVNDEVIVKFLAKGIDVEVKEGKVLSKKNKELVGSCVESLKSTAAGLEQLLASSETVVEDSSATDKGIQENPAKKSVVIKGRNSVSVKELTQDELIIRALKQIAGASAFALGQSKK